MRIYKKKKKTEKKNHLKMDELTVKKKRVRFISVFLSLHERDWIFLFMKIANDDSSSKFSEEKLFSYPSSEWYFILLD